MKTLLGSCRSRRTKKHTLLVSIAAAAAAAAAPCIGFLHLTQQAVDLVLV